MKIAAVAAGLALVTSAGLARAEGEGRHYAIHPSLRVVGVANDNLYYDRGNDRQEGVGIWVQPGLELGYRGRTFELGADLGADVRRYPGEGRLSEEFWRLHGFAEFGLLPGLTARVSDTFVPQPFQLGRPEDGTDNLVQTHRIDAQLRYWRELSKAREIELGARASRFLTDSFRADVPDSDGVLRVDDNFRADYWEGAIYTEFQNPLGRLTNVYVRSQAQVRTYDDSPRSDNTDVSMMLGLRTGRFKNFEIDVAGGYGFLQFHERGHRHRVIADATVKHRLPRGWSWRMAASNQFTADLAANEFMETTLSVGVEKHFGERTAASLDLFATRFENESWDEDVNFFSGAELQLRRQFTRRIQGRIRYRHWRNGGDYVFDDFHQNQIAIDLAYRY